MFKKPIELADDYIFVTLQGEGMLLGSKSIFVRLAGCSVGCSGCDTAYDKNKIELNAKDIAIKIKNLSEFNFCQWVCITGGEPTDYDLAEICYEIKNINREKSISIATSGIRKTDAVYDFISVSPHFKPNRMAISSGNQINLVPGLGDLNLNDWENYDFCGFETKYITPYSTKKESLAECFEWIQTHPEFRLGIQAHKYWGIR